MVFSRKQANGMALQRAPTVMMCARLIFLALGGLLAFGIAPPLPPAVAQGVSGSGNGGAGANVPRFVSLKASRVNLRKGPGTEYPTSWVFRRAGLPVEVIREYALWREVRDSEGTTGWVLRSLLSARRTGQILPWVAKTEAEPGKADSRIAILSRKSDRAKAVAIVEPGVITDLHTCDGSWCRVSVASYNGYVRQNKIWGIYPKERF